MALPAPLRTHAQIAGEVLLEVAAPVTWRAIVDALEVRYPALRGTIREHGTGKRRAFVRFYACQRDVSHEPPDTPLPEGITSGAEPFVILGAMAGG